MMQEPTVVCLILLWIGAVLPSCGGEAEDGYLKLALETEPTTADPVYSVDYSSGLVSSLVHANLVRFTPEAELTADLAASWEISGDSREYTFHLGDSRFACGRPVRADDVVYSFRRLLDPAQVSPRWWVLRDVEGALAFHEGGAFERVGISAPDDSTIVLRLEEPTAHFLSLLAMPAAGIVCRHDTEALGREYGIRPCGSGPWSIGEWREGDELVLVPNPHAGRRSPALEGISMRIIPESMTRIAEFEVGNLDILEIPGSELELWRSAGAPLLSSEELRVVYVGLNNSRPPFSDPMVRQALNLAVDVEAIIVHVLFGAAARARGTVPSALRGSPQQDGRYRYDPEKARELLARAGYGEGFDMEIWQRESPQGGRVLESIQAYLAEVGVRARIVTREWGAFKQAVDKGTPDAFFLDWFADYPDAENFLAPLFHSRNRGGGGNRTGYSNLAVDSLIDAAAFSGGPDQRWELYMRAEEIIYADAPWIFLWFPIRYEIVSPRIRGYTIPVIFNGQRFLDVTI
jgi:ABC-type transport system substrate-binding protein